MDKFNFEFFKNDKYTKRGINMSNVYKNGNFIPNIWTRVDVLDPLPLDGAVHISLTKWQKEKFLLSEYSSPLGLFLRPDENVNEIRSELEKFASIALEFPKFTDGRSYSTARILREQLNFHGDIRAFGDILLDQIPFMQRCGFTEFEITHEPTLKALKRDHNPEMTIYTQSVGKENSPHVSERPWLRQNTVDASLNV